MSDELRYKVMRSGCEVPSSAGSLSPHLARLILAGLADHADNNGVLFVSYRTLATELNCSHSSTLVAYRLFEAHRLLIRTGRRRGQGGAIEYQLCLDTLIPQNRAYYLPTALSTHATSPSRSDLSTEQAMCPPSSPTTCLPTALSNQAVSRSRSESVSLHSEALFRQALDIELEFRQSKKYSLEQLACLKREDYLKVCKSVLAEYPTAQPSSSPDRELAILVASRMNPTFPALQLTPASKLELERRYRIKPTTTEQPMSIERIRELTHQRRRNSELRDSKRE